MENASVRRILATTTLAGLLGMLLMAGDANAFGHHKKAPACPPPCYNPCPPPQPCYIPPPPPPCYIPCPPPAPVCQPCPPPKTGCKLFGGGGGLFGHKRKAQTCALTYACAPTYYPAPAPGCSSCGY